MIAPNNNIVLNDDEKDQMIQEIAKKYEEILDIMKYDRSNHNIEDTPMRIAKMYVNEIFSGCYNAEPKITVFPDAGNVDQMITVGPIDLKSTCSHHFQNFVGEAYISYIPKDKVVGVSKFARIVDWYARRPQIQEELTEQIASYIEKTLDPLGLGVYISAKHFCMCVRGVEQFNSHMNTCAVRGNFQDPSAKNEFMQSIYMNKK